VAAVVRAAAAAAAAACQPHESISPEVDVDMLLSLAKCLKEEAHARQLL
jgi:hypothetical protein